LSIVEVRKSAAEEDILFLTCGIEELFEDVLDFAHFSSFTVVPKRLVFESRPAAFTEEQGDNVIDDAHGEEVPEVI
jgi:hypothetical protein